MIETYVVVNQPALARPEPSPSAQIINSYPVDSKIQIVDVDSGWYKTISGTYIFKTNQNLITLTKWKKIHANDLIMTESVGKEVPPLLKRSLQKISDSVVVGDKVRLKNKNVEDINTGNKIAEEDWDPNTIYIIIKIDGSDVTIQNLNKNSQYTVKASDLLVRDGKDEEKWIDVSNVATSINSTLSSVVDSIKDLFITHPVSQVNNKNIGNLDVKYIRAVYGMPYQYLPTTDNRIDGSTTLSVFGRKYAEKIVTKAPILVLQAGIPNFMKGWNEEAKSSILSSIQQYSSVDFSNDQLKEIENQGNSQYYTLKLVPGSYFNAVNQMSRAMTQLLGIYDFPWNVEGQDIPLGDMQWERSTVRHEVVLRSLNLTYGQVPFYVNADATIQEAISNQTTQSQVLAKLNDLGRMGSELQFLLGGASSKLNNSFGINPIPDFLTNEHIVTNKNIMNDGGIFDSIIDNFQTAVAGGRFIFPDLWSDSQFMRSYTVNIKLDSPDCDVVSIFINIFLPLLHILAFCLPRSIGNNNYTSPFLVRAFYKSRFHVDLGIITDCQITKGEVGAWTQTGLPTQVNVQLTIKDLYSLITLATGLNNNSITANPGQLDYIANMCGINLSAPALVRSVLLYLAVNNPKTLLSHIETAFEGLKTDLYLSFWDKLLHSITPKAIR